MNLDLINGLFEFLGGSFTFINVLRLYKDKQLRGVSWIPTVFFTLWGYWNLFYYPALHQWWSFSGGACLAFVNSLWIGQVFYYKIVTKLRIDGK